MKMKSFSKISQTIPALVAVLALCLVVVLPLTPVRRWLFGRAKPMFAQVGPRLVAVAQRPGKLAVGIGGTAARRGFGTWRTSIAPRRARPGWQLVIHWDQSYRRCRRSSAVRTCAG